MRSRHAASVSSAAERAACAASRSSAIFFSRASTVAWIRGTIPRAITKKMKPSPIASQKSCDRKTSESCES